MPPLSLYLPPQLLLRQLPQLLPLSPPGLQLLILQLEERGVSGMRGEGPRKCFAVRGGGNALHQLSCIRLAAGSSNAYERGVCPCYSPNGSCLSPPPQLPPRPAHPSPLSAHAALLLAAAASKHCTPPAHLSIGSAADT